MAKKKTAVFTATLTLNPEKGGAWMAYYTATVFEDKVGLNTIPDSNGVGGQSAWKNASAAKRWIKEKVLENTPRKSVKMLPVEFDENEKPIRFEGKLEYKVTE